MQSFASQNKSAMPVVVAISGLTGSGKSAIAEQVLEKLNENGSLGKFRYVSASYKSVPGAMEKVLQGNADKKLANSFDDMINREAHKGNSVVTAWLGAWLLRRDEGLNVFAVWLDAPLDVRVARKAESEMKGKDLSEIKEYIRTKDENTAEHFMKEYKIDILEHKLIKDGGVFDMIIDTTQDTIIGIADSIVKMVCETIDGILAK